MSTAGASATFSFIGDPSSYINAIQQSVQATAKLQQSVAQSNTSFSTQAKGVQQSVQSIGALSTASASSGANVAKMGAIINTSGNYANTASNSQLQYANRLNSSGRAAMDNATSNSSLNGILSSSGKIVTTTSQSHDALGNAMTQSATAATKTGESQRSLGDSMKLTVGFMGNAVAAGFNLYNAFDSLQDAQLRVSQATTRLNSMQNSAVRIQNDLNAMVAKGQQGSQAYAEKQAQLQVIQERIANQTEVVTNRQEDLANTYGYFVQSIIPLLIQSTTSIIAGYKGMQEGIIGLTSRVSGFSSRLMDSVPAFAAAGGGAKGFAAALGSITLAAAPLLIVLAAIAAVAIAYKTNFMGFRTEADKLGVAMKNLNPVFGLISDSLKFIAVRLGLVSGNAQQLSDDIWRDSYEIQKAFGEMFSWENIGKQVSGFFSNLGLAFTRGLDVIGEAMGNFFSTNLLAPLIRFFDVMIPNAIAGAAKVGGVVIKWLNDNIITPIIQGIQTIPGMISAGALNLVAIIWQSLVSASKPITDAIQWLQTNIVTPITSAILSIPTLLTSGFVDLVAIIWQGLKTASKIITDAVAWLQTYIVAPITSAVLSIPTQLAVGSIDIAGIIWKALQAASKIITDALVWLKTNIFDPIVEPLKAENIVKNIAITVDLAKTIWDALVKGSTDLAASIKKWVEDNIGKPLIDGLKAWIGWIPGVNEELNKLKASLEGVAPPVEKLKKGFDNTTPSVDALNKKFDEADKLADSVTKGIQKQSATVEEAIPKWQNVALVVNQSTNGYGSFIPVAEAASDAQSQGAQSADKSTDAIKRNLATLNENTKGLNEHITTTSILIDQMGLQEAKDLELVRTMIAMADTYVKLKDANTELTAATKAHALLIDQTTFKNELMTKGMLTQYKAFQDLEDKNISETAALKEYVRELDNGTLATEKFTEGQNEQLRKMLDTQAETAKLAGNVSELSAELLTGTIQVTTYNNAWNKAELAFGQAIVDISKLSAEVDNNAMHLADGSAQLLAYNKGLLEGRKAFQDFITSTLEASAKSEVFNAKIQGLVNAFGGLPPFLERTNENFKTFAEALLGSDTAVQKLKDDLVKFFSTVQSDAASFISGIAGQFKDLNDHIKKPFKDLPDYVRKAMTPDEKAFALAAARGEALGKQITGPFSMILAKEGPAAAADFLERVQMGLKNFDDKAALAPIIEGLRSGTAAGVVGAIQELEKLKNPMGSIAQDMMLTYNEALLKLPKDTNAAVQQIIEQFNDPALTQTPREKALQIAQVFQDANIKLDDAKIQQVADQLGIPIETLKAAIMTVKPAVDTGITQPYQNMPTTIEGANTTAIGIVQAFVDAVIGVTTAFTKLQTNASTVFENIGTLVQGVVGPINNNFKRAVDDATGYLNTLLRNAQNTFNQVGAASSTIVGKINDSFKRAEGDASGYLATLQRNAVSVFNAVGSAGQAAGNRVSNGMRQIQSSAQSAVQTVNQLKSAIDSLRDKTVTITIRYVTVGSPGGYSLSHTPKSLGKTVTLPAATAAGNEEQNNLVTELNAPTVAVGGTGGVGGRGTRRGSIGTRKISVSGKIDDNRPIQVILDGRVLTTAIQRRLLEFSDSLI